MFPDYLGSERNNSIQFLPRRLPVLQGPRASRQTLGFPLPAHSEPSGLQGEDSTATDATERSGQGSRVHTDAQPPPDLGGGGGFANTSNRPSLPQRLLSRPQGRSYQASHRGAGDMVSPVSSPLSSPAYTGLQGDSGHRKCGSSAK